MEIFKIMGAGQKKLNKIYIDLMVVEKIYADNRLPYEYYDRLEDLRNRMKKIPKIINNRKILENELKWILSEYNEIMSEILPETIKKYKEDYDLGGLNGDIREEPTL
jgi:hypothetical protein